jgi:hypothetical protein
MTRRTATAFIECLVERNKHFKEWCIKNKYIFFEKYSGNCWVAGYSTDRQAVREYTKQYGFKKEDYNFYNAIHGDVYGYVYANTRI